MEPYVYTPITEAGGIRLFHLQPSEDSAAMIQCHLIHTTLVDIQREVIDHYTALSYVWGSPSDQVTISVDGKSLAVTRNLDIALRQLRDCTRVFILWADGICIDQQSNDDKIIQVQQMGQVYEYATHSIIFLGAPTQASDLVFNTVNAFQLNSDLNSTFRFMVKNDLLGNDILGEKKESASEEAVERFIGSLFEALDQMLSRPWFYRVWIYQELILSRDPRVQCGSLRCTWDNLYSFASNVGLELSTKESAIPTSDKYAKDTGIQGGTTVSTTTQLKTKTFGVLAAMQEGRSQYRFSRGSWPQYLPESAIQIHRLFKTLISRRGYGVHDKRDMIYAHLGIIKDTGIKVDYEQSVANMYSDFAKAYIEATEGYEILGLLEDIDLDARMPNLKSWAPDWTAVTNRDNSLFEWSYVEDTRGHYRDYVDPPSSSEIFSYFREWTSDTNLLCCVGFVTHRITDLTPIMPDIEERSKIPPNSGSFGSWARDGWVEGRKSLYKPWENLLKFDQLLWIQKHLQQTEGNHSTDPEARTYFRHRGYQKTLELYIAQRSEAIVGRRVASLDGDELALVPASTKIGDLICCLKSFGTSLVVRSVSEVDPKIEEEVLAARCSKFGEVDLDVRHYRIVGQCFVVQKVDYGVWDWNDMKVTDKMSLLVFH